MCSLDVQFSGSSGNSYVLEVDGSTFYGSDECGGKRLLKNSNTAAAPEGKVEVKKDGKGTTMTVRAAWTAKYVDAVQVTAECTYQIVDGTDCTDCNGCTGPTPPPANHDDDGHDHDHGSSASASSASELRPAQRPDLLVVALIAWACGTIWS